MEKHAAHDDVMKELDNMVSRINGLEASSTDEYQVGNGKCSQDISTGRDKPV